MSNQSRGQEKRRIHKNNFINGTRILFFHLRNSVFDANLKASKCYLGLLGKNYNKSPNLFKESLEDWQKEEFVRLKKQVLTTNLLEVIEPVEEYPNIFSTSDPIPEKEIVTLLLYGQLEKLTKPLRLISPRWGGDEIPINVGNPGENYVDLILDDTGDERKTRYIIELKTHRADHKVIGQIKKYELHYQKKIIYGLWHRVVPVVIAHGFDKTTRTKLKKKGVRTFLYESPKEKITFTEV